VKSAFGAGYDFPRPELAQQRSAENGAFKEVRPDGVDGRIVGVDAQFLERFLVGGIRDNRTRHFRGGLLHSLLGAIHGRDVPATAREALRHAHAELPQTDHQEFLAHFLILIRP
jgi:hypothetical protein